jgi:hypothetical protein
MAAPIKPCDADDSPTEVVLVVDGRNAWPAIAALALSVFAGHRGDVTQDVRRQRDLVLACPFLPSRLQATDLTGGSCSPPSPFSPISAMMLLGFGGLAPVARSICDLGHKIIFSPDV